jgi:hypothetical protein
LGAFAFSSYDTMFAGTVFVLVLAALFMDIQQAINLALLRRSRELGIAFAHPIRTLHVTPHANQARVDVGMSSHPHIAPVPGK